MCDHPIFYSHNDRTTDSCDVEYCSLPPLRTDDNDGPYSTSNGISSSDLYSMHRLINKCDDPPLRKRNDSTV